MTTVEPSKYRLTSREIGWFASRCIVHITIIIAVIWLTILAFQAPGSEEPDIYIELAPVFICALLVPFSAYADITRTLGRPKKRRDADQLKLDWKILLRALTELEEYAVVEVYEQTNLRVFVINQDATQRILCRQGDSDIEIKVDGPRAAEAVAAVLNQLDETSQTHLITKAA